MSKGWIGVDLDGTLAEHHDNWNYPDIGEPIMPMVNRVKGWLADGREVRIFTARVHPSVDPYRHNLLRIRDWAEDHIGVRLGVTCQKDPAMLELWDDRAVRVARNTGYIDNSYGNNG